MGAGVAEPAMPQIREPGDGGGEGDGGVTRSVVGEDWVELAATVASVQRRLGDVILHSQTKRIKLYGKIIVSSKATNGKKVFDDIRSDQNVLKIERTGGISKCG